LGDEETQAPTCLSFFKKLSKNDSRRKPPCSKIKTVIVYLEKLGFMFCLSTACPSVIDYMKNYFQNFQKGE